MKDGQILYAKVGSTYILKFTGDIRYTICAPLTTFITQLYGRDGYDDIVIDLTEADSIDSTNLGLLARIANLMDDRFGCRTTMVSTNENVNRTLETVGFFDVFTIDDGHDSFVDDLQALPGGSSTEEEMARAILQAHRTLSELNDSNREMFRNVVEGLEAELDGVTTVH